MKAMMGGVMLVGIIMAASGGMQLGSLGEPPFPYDSAGTEDRRAYLQKHADKMTKRVSKALFNPAPGTPKFDVDSLKVDAQTRKVSVVMKASTSLQANHAGFAKLDEALRSGFCPSYMRSGPGKHRVETTYKFVKKDGMPIRIVRFSPSGCKRFVDGAV